MIGNDIIDLQESRKESNWQRKGWVSKLFTAQEQLQIRASADQELMVWLMWSMKESVYKICNRTTRKMCYAPHKFICGPILQQDTEASGCVMFQESVFKTASSISADLIHTVASRQNNLQDVQVYIEHVEQHICFCSGEQLLFKDRDGIPYLFEMDSGKIKDVSLSHHGRFEAIAFF